MKQNALEFVGYCRDLLTLTAIVRKAAELLHREHRDDEGEIARGRAASVVPLVQIGVVALDYRLLQEGSCRSEAFGGRCLGPARVIASVG